MKRLLLVVTLMASFGVAGCETVSGVGKDLQKASDAVQRAAD